VKGCGAKLSGTVRDVPAPERIDDVVNVGRLLSYLLSSFLSPSIAEADAALAFLSSRRSALCERLSLSSFESLSVYISRCRKGHPGTSRFSPPIVAKLLEPDDRMIGVRESEWVVYDDTVIFSTCQFNIHKQHAFRRDTYGSKLVHHTIATSLFVRYSVAATPAGRLCNTMTRKRRRIRLRKALHIPVTVLYTPQLLLISLRTRNITERR